MFVCGIVVDYVNLLCWLVVLCGGVLCDIGYCDGVGIGGDEVVVVDFFRYDFFFGCV